MDDRQDSRYEELYEQLLERGLDMHMHNKRRIRNGMILLLLLPVGDLHVHPLDLPHHDRVHR